MLAEPLFGGGEQFRQRQEAGRQKRGSDSAGLAEPVAQGGEVARAAAPERQAAQGALDIGTMLQALAQGGARVRPLDKERDRVEPRFDLLRDRQRPREMLGEKARAGAGQGAIDRRQKTAAPLAREALGQFEVAPRRSVDLHDRAGDDALRRHQIGGAALLRPGLLS